MLDKEVLEKNNNSNISHQDLEMGKSLPCPNCFRLNSDSNDEDDMYKVLNSFLQQYSKEAVDVISGIDEGEKEIKSQVVLSLSAFGYGMKLKFNWRNQTD